MVENLSLALPESVWFGEKGAELGEDCWTCVVVAATSDGVGAARVKVHQDSSMMGRNVRISIIRAVHSKVSK